MELFDSFYVTICLYMTWYEMRKLGKNSVFFSCWFGADSWGEGEEVMIGLIKYSICTSGSFSSRYFDSLFDQTLIIGVKLKIKFELFGKPHGFDSSSKVMNLVHAIFFQMDSLKWDFDLFSWYLVLSPTMRPVLENAISFWHNFNSL